MRSTRPKISVEWSVSWQRTRCSFATRRRARPHRSPAGMLRVLVSAPYAMPVIDLYRERLSAAGCEMAVATVRERLTEQELLPLIPDVDGLICGDDQVTRRVLAAAVK